MMIFDEKKYLDLEEKRLLKELKKVKKEGLAWKIEIIEKALVDHRRA